MTRRRQIPVRIPVFICGCLLTLTTIEIGFAQQQPLQFGGAYSGLGECRQRLDRFIRAAS